MKNQLKELIEISKKKVKELEKEDRELRTIGVPYTNIAKIKIYNFYINELEEILGKK